MNLLRVRPDTLGRESPPGQYGLPSPGEEFAGSIFGLSAGETYEIKVTVTDPDGGGGTQTIVAATRALPPVAPGNPNEIVATTSSEFSSALANASPGDVVRLAAGTYQGAFSVSASGTAADPIIVRGAGIADTIVDASGASYGLTVSGSHVIVEHFSVTNSVWGARLSGSHNITIRQMRFASVERGIDGRNGSHRDYYICDNVLEGTHVWPDVSSSTWNDEGIVVTGEGHVICHNTISGFGDALGTSQNTSLPNRAIDFYGNDVLWTGDDGMELDYVHRNVRAFANRISNSGMGVSVQPSWGGPVYIIRNVMVNHAHSAYKFNNDPSGIIVLNNTSVRTQGRGNFGGAAWPQLGYRQSDGDWSYVANFVFMNNLAIGVTRPAKFTSNIILGTIDHNGWWPDGTFDFYDTFANLADVQARSSYEASGLILSDPFFEDDLALGGDYTAAVADPQVVLRANSNAVDAGMVFPNVTDGFTGNAPDLGAWERGQARSIYGVRVASMSIPKPPSNLSVE